MKVLKFGSGCGPDNSAEARNWLRTAWSLVWVAYLPLYFMSWFWRRPGPVELWASLAAVGVFAVVVAHMYLKAGGARLWHVLAMFVLGMALSRFETGWCVYTIYAMAFAARLTPRRRAVALMLVLEAIVLAYGLTEPLFSIWISAAVFGALTGLTALFQADLERKNEELAAANEEVRTLAVTAERERISRDLHDLLGHTLTLVAVKAELAARLASRDAAAAEREMQEVADAAREALSEVRTAVAGMRGAALGAEIERARRMLAAANVAVDVSAPAAPVDPQREAVLAMALREAVTNVIRHAAGVTRCTIRVEQAPPGELSLSVVDNGAGPSGEVSEGSGLKGMRARLAAVGGSLEFKPGRRGSRLLARLPAEAAA